MFIFFKILKIFLFPTQLRADGEHGGDLPVRGTGEGDGWALSFLLKMHCDRGSPTVASPWHHNTLLAPCDISLNPRVISVIRPSLLHKCTTAQQLQLSALGFSQTLLHQWRNFCFFLSPEHFPTLFGFPERQTNGTNYFKTCINNPAGWA